MSPKRNLASSLPISVLRKPATIRLSFKMLLAARILPWKYDSRFLTGSTSGISSSVEEAGIRAPCFARILRAGPHCGLCGCGGERYRDRRV